MVKFRFRCTINLTNHSHGYNNTTQHNDYLYEQTTTFAIPYVETGYLAKGLTYAKAARAESTLEPALITDRHCEARSGREV